MDHRPPRGWNGYSKPPGAKTMADGWRRLAAMLDG
jgi:hypothetical protein